MQTCAARRLVREARPQFARVMCTSGANHWCAIPGTVCRCQPPDFPGCRPDYPGMRSRRESRPPESDCGNVLVVIEQALSVGRLVQLGLARRSPKTVQSTANHAKSLHKTTAAPGGAAARLQPPNRRVKCSTNSRSLGSLARHACRKKPQH